MRRVVRLSSGIGLLCGGYVLGSLQIGGPAFLRAEPQPQSSSQSQSQSLSEGIPDAVKSKVREANRALADAIQALGEEKRYVAAIQGVNAFAASAGGVDAIADLESGQGVDPETYAGLLSGQALPEVAENLSRDAEGRLTYKNKSIRIYSPTRLRQLFALRAELAPVSTGPAPAAAAATKKAAGKKAEADE
jgi:hypothetical protein